MEMGVFMVGVLLGEFHESLAKSLPLLVQPAGGGDENPKLRDGFRHGGASERSLADERLPGWLMNLTHHHRTAQYRCRRDFTTKHTKDTKDTKLFRYCAAPHQKSAAARPIPS
jgi:hypothetical protein